MNNVIKNEPVMVSGSIVAAVMALLSMLVVFGVITLDAEQMSAIETALLAIIPALLPLIGAWLARSKVRPVAKLRDEDSDPLRADEVFVP